MRNRRWSLDGNEKKCAVRVSSLSARELQRSTGSLDEYLGALQA